MKKVVLFLLFIIISFSIHAQSSWQHLPDAGLHSVTTLRFEDVYFTDSVTGFAITLGGGIFRTRDAGRNWTSQIQSQAQFRSIEFLDDRQTGVVGSLSDSVYRTSDGGNTWTNISGALVDPIPYSHKYICGIAHWKNSFFAVGSWNSKIARLFKSTDQGISWNCTYLDTNLISAAIDVCFIAQDTGFITGAYISPGFNKMMSAVVKTTDGGLSWKRVFVDSVIGGRIWKIQALSSQVLFGSIEPYYNSDTVAMIKSTDGGNSWAVIGTGFRSPAHITQGVGFINEKHGWIGGQYHGLYETWDGGQTWISVNFGDDFNRFFVLDEKHVYAGGKEIYFYGGQLPWPPLGVDQYQNTPPHILYPVTPNPAGGKVKIEFDLLCSTNVLLQVASIDSKRSWQIDSRRLPAGHYTYYWDGSDAPAGNYMIWLGTDEIPIVQKFTLLHSD
jgi:photosystem II stability/assembly factor-like uncharacterized protein